MEETKEQSFDSKKFKDYLYKSNSTTQRSSQDSTGDIKQLIDNAGSEENGKRKRQKKGIYIRTESINSEKSKESDERKVDNKELVVNLQKGQKIIYKQQRINIYGTVKNPLFLLQQINQILQIKNIIEEIANFQEDQILITKVYQSNQEPIYLLTELGVYELINRQKCEKANEFKNWMYSLLKEIQQIEINILQQQNAQLQQQYCEQQNIQKLIQTLHKNEIQQKEKYIEKIPRLGQINVDYAFINDENYFRIGSENVNKEKEEFGLEERRIYTQECINSEYLEDQIKHVLISMGYYNKDQKAYKCDIEIIKAVSQTLGSTYDTLYKSREGMSLNEMQKKIQEKQDEYVQKEENKKNKMLITY